MYKALACFVLKWPTLFSGYYFCADQASDSRTILISP